MSTSTLVCRHNDKLLQLSLGLQLSMSMHSSRSKGVSYCPSPQDTAFVAWAYTAVCAGCCVYTNLLSQLQGVCSASSLKIQSLSS